VRARRSPARAALLGLALLGAAAAAVTEAVAVHDTVLQGIAAGHAGRIFILKMNMREPESGANNAPMFDKDGWHFWNPSGRIVLAEGERVEVTGVYNYSTRGFFLELTREDTALGGEPVQSRPRIRFRIMVEAEMDKPEDQATQTTALIGEILRPIDPILPTPPSE
jgi:hypothetical protein